jgi:hypothetical protein
MFVLRRGSVDTHIRERSIAFLIAVCALFLVGADSISSAAADSNRPERPKGDEVIDEGNPLPSEGGQQPAPNRSASPDRVELPCGSKPFDSCSVVRQRVLNGREADQAKGIAKVVGFREVVKSAMEDVYSGKMRVSVYNGTEECATFAVVGKPPICPILKVTENGCKDESAKNHLDESCKELSKVGQSSSDKYYYTLGKSASGSRETANIAGGLVLAVSDEAAAIEREILSGTFTIPASSACYSQANALKTLVARQTEVNLLNRIKETDVSGTGTASALNYFNANVAALESAFVLLAKCRLIKASEKSFREFAANYSKDIDSAVVNSCFHRNKGNPANFRKCYQSEFNSWIKTRAKKSFPIVAASCGN